MNAATIALATTLIALIAPSSVAEVWQPPESIRSAAEQFALETLAGYADISVQARGVDERLKLPACATALQAGVERPLRNGQGTVSVSCSGPQPWRLLVPVRASHQVQVLVAQRNLVRGQRLTAADVSLQPRQSSTLPYQYLTRLQEAVGLNIRRSVAAGAVLVPAALDRPRLVQRGQLVTLIAGSGGIMVKSEGIALEDATLNQRVRIKTRAGRVVEGVVEAQSQVRVGS